MKPRVLLLYFTLATCSLSFAQPGALDLSFVSSVGDHVRNTAVQPDGKVIFVGEFWSYNSSALSHIARVLSNGSVDTSFHIGNGTDAKIYALALQPDGKIIIGGDFHYYDSIPVNRIARLNSNGVLDTSFHIGNGADNSVKVLCLQSDGKILMGGNFLQYNNTVCNRIVRINANGTADTTFTPGTAANGTVECIAVKPDGKIMVGGSFTNFNGTMDIRIARLNANGTIDSTLNEGFGGANSTVIAMAFQDDTNIIIGGNFTTYNLQSLPHIARLSPSGDPNNNFFQGTGANSTIAAIATDAAGYIYIGGSFTDYDGTTVNRMARLTPTGRIDSTFNSTETGADGDISSISFQPDGNIIIGGDFLSYNDILKHRIARLYNCLTPQPDSIYGNTNALCSGTAQTYFVNPVAGATKYEWTLPNGWTGSSDSASIVAISSGTGGTITVKAFTDSCGYSYPTTRTINTIQPPGVNICLVTVDTASTHNIIMWNKPATSLIDSFFIYRETATSVYTKIAAVPYDSLSEYHDTAANPNATSYRYKLSVVDTCGAESALSPYHNTIHLQNLGSGNFQWTFYQIENQLNPVISFNVYRDNNSNGNYSTIGNVPGTNATFSDVTYNSFPNSEYVVDVNWSIACNSTRAVNTTRSNKRPHDYIDVAINETEITPQLQVYPNPANGVVYISYPASLQVSRLQLFNAIGQIIITKTAEDNLHQIDITKLPKGIYTLSAETNAGRVVKKIVVE